MSNVIALAKNTQVGSQVERLSFLDELHNQGAIFDVDVVANTHPFTLPNGEVEYRDTGMKTIIRKDSGKAISVRSPTYRAFQNREIFSAMDKQIAASNLDLEGAHTKVEVGYNSRRVAVQYLFPAHTIDVGGGDESCLQVIAINSFDGSTCFHVHLGAYRGYCLNTQVFGTDIVGLKVKHQKDLDLDRIATVIGRGIEVFGMEGEIWKEMTRTLTTEPTVYAAMAKLAGTNTTIYPDYDAYLRRVLTKKVTNSKLDNYMGIWQKYKDELGMTEFALYNTLTHIATHGAAKSGKPLKESMANFSRKSAEVRNISQQFLTAYQAA